MYKLFTDEFGNEYVKLIHSPQSHTLIPLKEENADYQRYSKWLAKGNTPEPADPVVEPITNSEKLDALLEGGVKLEELKARIAARKL